MRKCIGILAVVLALFLVTGFTVSANKEVPLTAEMHLALADSTKTVKPSAVKPAEPRLKLYKKNVLATYYADKFNGRKTTSGERFNNKNYTAAHMKLPLGTMVRVTNEANGKWVDVKVNDRGPYSKKLEIDLTKRAFMDIASNKGSGTFKVKIEIIEK